MYSLQKMVKRVIKVCNSKNNAYLCQIINRCTI